jgi:NAD(P)-dependent dehydrogenase (short-subunit alcohol dehydrogenase family)
MNGKSAIVTGVGPGTGRSVVQRFSNGGYRVAMIARTEERLRQFERDIPNTKAFVVDVSDPAQLSRTMDCIREELGVPNVVIHNAVGGVLGNFMQVDPAILERNFQTNVMALFHLARRFAPMMADLDRGAIIASGNTSALRGRSDFAGFAPTKAAQRILAESLARELGPKGVHVAYVLVDAVIDLEWTRKRWPDRPDNFFIKPADIADEIWHVAHQPRGAWSFNVELRPHGELW